MISQNPIDALIELIEPNLPEGLTLDYDKLNEAKVYLEEEVYENERT